MKHRAVLAQVMVILSATVHAQEVDMARRAEERKSLHWGMVCWSFSTFSGQEWTSGLITPAGCATSTYRRCARSGK